MLPAPSSPPQHPSRALGTSDVLLHPPSHLLPHLCSSSDGLLPQSQGLLPSEAFCHPMDLHKTWPSCSSSLKLSSAFGFQGLVLSGSSPLSLTPVPSFIPYPTNT